MIMGFIVAETGLWPRVAGLEGAILQGDYDKYFKTIKRNCFMVHL